MRNRGRKNRNRCAAFSLFEIVVAMAILGIISGAVFSILWQAGDTAAEIRELDQRDEEVSRFLALLRESIENLPPDGTLSMKPAEEAASGYPELVIGNSATGFTFGEIVGSSEETVISLRPGKVSPEGEPTFDLAISRSDFVPEDTDGSGMVFGAGEDDFLQSDDEGRYWLPLLSGITAASWNFWDEKQKVWIDEWTDDEKMPVLLAFSFDDRYRPVPLRVVFEVPEQASNPSSGETTQTTTPATSSTSTVQPSGGTKGQPGGGGQGRPGAGQEGGGKGGSGEGRGGPGDGRGRPGGGGEGRPGGGGPPGGSGSEGGNR